jgi:AcrR family transcriptional regulator
MRSQGYAKTTVVDIATACAMSPANIYRFFESKAAINKAITAEILKRVEDMALGISNEARPASHRLKKMITEMHRFACEQYLHDSRVHELVRQAMDQQWDVINKHIERLRSLYRNVLDDGRRSGEFSTQLSEAHCACVFNAVLPFYHPQLVAEQFSGDNGHQAILMADFLTKVLRAWA